jgi:hypothetical protein
VRCRRGDYMQTAAGEQLRGASLLARGSRGWGLAALPEDGGNDDDQNDS